MKKYASFSWETYLVKDAVLISKRYLFQVIMIRHDVWAHPMSYHTSVFSVHDYHANHDSFLLIRSTVIVRFPFSFLILSGSVFHDGFSYLSMICVFIAVDFLPPGCQIHIFC